MEDKRACCQLEFGKTRGARQPLWWLTLFTDSLMLTRAALEGKGTRSDPKRKYFSPGLGRLFITEQWVVSIFKVSCWRLR